MKNKKIIIAIIGKSASGKDSLAKSLQCFLKDDYDCKNIVSYTTRPRRNNEINGEDYFFVDDLIFFTKKKDGEFLETSSFNGWNYGTPREMYHQINIGVFNVEGLYSISKKEYIVIPVFLNCPFIERIKRSIQREGKIKFEFFRRAITDYKDFKDMYWMIKFWEHYFIIDTRDISTYKATMNIIKLLKYWSII